MDGQRPESITDDALDRELARALSVQPSPEFLAKVRTRIASEPPPRAWYGRWAFVAPAAAAAVVVLAVSVALWPAAEPTAPAGDRSLSPRQAVSTGTSVTDHDTQRPRVTEGASAAGAPADVARTFQVRAASPQGSPHDSSAADASAASVDRPPFPEVIVSPAEQRAYAQFVALALDGRLPPLPPPAEVDEDAPLGPPPIEIAPLVIEPLPPLARLEGAGL